MSEDLRGQVVEQARLFVRFLSTISDGDHPVELDGHRADLAELLFQGLENLHEVARELDGGHRSVPAAASGPDDKRRDYHELVERIRSRITKELPLGSVVAVVSRGDARLVQLPGMTGWHFPQNDLGVWAGYHPATGRDAIDHLAALRRRGARFALIPSTSFWWLDFYEEFRAHLQREAEVVAADDDMMLYRFSAGSPMAASSHEVDRYYSVVDQFVGFVDALLPKGSSLAVISRGDDSWLATKRVVARHFPADERGRFTGWPADDEDASRALSRSLVSGAHYLAVPVQFCWWTEEYPDFFRTLRTRHRCIAHQDELGVIYELNNLQKAAD